MAQVEATTERVVAADAEKVFDALADYSGTRQKLLPEHFSEYEVREGGDGEGVEHLLRVRRDDPLRSGLDLRH